MDQSIDQRMARVVASRRARQAMERREESLDRERRALRAHVLDELPRFGAKLAAAISDLNDRLEGENVWLHSGEATRNAVSEAIYSVDIDDHHLDLPENPVLFINIDYRGKANFVIKKGEVRALVKSCMIFELESSIVLDALVQLLEFRYDAN